MVRIWSKDVTAIKRDGVNVMMLSVSSTIGRPVLTASDADTGFKISLTIPHDVMAELVRGCARDLLWNGTIEQATDIVQIARDIVDNF